MKFNYANKKQLIQDIRNVKGCLWEYVDWNKNKENITWIDRGYQFSLTAYSNFFYPNIVLTKLINIINKLESLSKSKSKYLDTEELISDLNYIKYYYKKEKRYVSVIRWLSNIESTIHTLFNEYMDDIKNNPKKISNKNK